MRYEAPRIERRSEARGLMGDLSILDTSDGTSAS